jgi:hypothetical protein
MIPGGMPSPVGHLLAGLTVGWGTEGNPHLHPDSSLRTFTPFVIWCALVAALPDADLLIPHFHRTATHSLTATALIFIVTAAVTRKVTGRADWRVASALAAAHATHLLLDWLGADPSPPRGFQLFWPFSGRFFISGWDAFPGTERRLRLGDFLAVNLHAALAEVAIVGPCAVAAWYVRRKRRSRAPISARDIPPRPSAAAAGTVGTSDRRALRGER